MARAFLWDPRWPWHAAVTLGGKVVAPPQYWRAMPREALEAFGDLKAGRRYVLRVAVARLPDGGEAARDRRLVLGFERFVSQENARRTTSRSRNANARATPTIAAARCVSQEMRGSIGSTPHTSVP